MKKLGINIDHIATLRNARGENHPNIIEIANIVKKSKADSITVHLREDRRHINDQDLSALCKKKFNINMEMAANLKMMNIAIKNNPKFVCLVPEKRNEITTEGGLNLKKNYKIIKMIVAKLNQKKIRTSLFVDPSISNLILSKKIGAKCVELHTGKISRLVKNNKNFKKELIKINECSKFGLINNIEIHAGHGLDYKTTKILCKIPHISEYNIGHFIIGESIKIGISKVIQNFIKIIK
ncbi:MAG: pyridoxine 5'-phosphate synthase [Candidatus Pelagibacter sp.]|tara:strand:- start:252 stop:965 length:714 start_codon:yes stop_codon:yes gene_type:complete